METTYKIIGGDGAEYGPVSFEELKRWISDGRVSPTTQVWQSEARRWAPASSYSEFRTELDQIEIMLAEKADQSLRPVGFWPRVGAYLIDVMVLQGIFFAVWGPGPSSPPAGPNGLPDLNAILRELSQRLPYEMIIILAYSVFLNGQFGATLGKLAIGARIVNVDGSRIGFVKALMRWLAMITSQLTLGIGYLLVAFRTDKRALHDLLAGTKVVYQR